MSNLICVLCGVEIAERPATFDAEYPREDRRHGPYHHLCLHYRDNANGAGEWIVPRVAAPYGMPYLIVLRKWGWLPERLAMWAADRLIRLAFRLIGQRARLVEQSEYFHASLLREPWATRWVHIEPDKEPERA